MSTKTRIPIQPLKDLAKKFGLSHVVLLAHQESSGLDHVVTYGKTIEQCSQAADFGNRLKESLGWPASLFAQPSRVKRLEQRIAELEFEVKSCRDLIGEASKALMSAGEWEQYELGKKLRPYTNAESE